MNPDNSFKDREELLQWLIDKKPVCIFNTDTIYYYSNSKYKATGYDFKLDSVLESYSKHFPPKPKKKVTLYRYFYSFRKDNYSSSQFTSKTWKDYSENAGGKLIHTDTIEFEVDTDE